MSDAVRDAEDIAAYYAHGLERDRLAAGAGALEFARTQALLERFLPQSPAVIVDAGGGPGRYAAWLAERGYRVHLVDPMPLHVEQARAAAGRSAATLASASVGDARALPFPDGSADAVLLLGPLYHLTERADRIPRARRGAPRLPIAQRRRRRGDLAICLADGRNANRLPRGSDVRRDGRGRPGARPPSQSDGRPVLLHHRVPHRPEDLSDECGAAGLVHEATLAVEGPAWLLPDLDARLADERRRAVLHGGTCPRRGRTSAPWRERTSARCRAPCMTWKQGST